MEAEVSQCRSPAGRIFPSRAERGTLRTIWRGFVLALGAVFLLTAGLALGSLLRPEGHSSTVVQSGDTLWSIASGIEGAPDTATAVADIVALNGLGSDAIAAGQTLRLPRY